MKKSICLYENEHVEVNGEKIYFDIEKKKIKNMYLKIKPDKKVIVSIPTRISLATAREFVKNKADWIKKQQETYNKMESKKETSSFENNEILYLLGRKYKLQLISSTKNSIEIENEYIKIHIKENYIGDKNYKKKIYEKWLKTYALNTFEELVIQYQKILQKYNIPMPQIEVKKMKSRWGSCIPIYKKVNFNLQLIKTPIECIEYVVLHELSHFKYQNHSKDFYNFIAIFMPDWKVRKKLLNTQYIFNE